MKKGINSLKGIMAVALSIMIFATNAMTVLAADWVTGTLLDSEDTFNFQPAGVTGATLTNPAQQATDRPLELSITTINGSQTPSVNPGQGGSGATESEPERISESVKVVYHHQCAYEWIVTLEPTLQDDGICSHICEECGSVDATQPISRYQAILRDIENRIEEAPQGATIEINYDFLSSVPKRIIDVLDQRNDLTVEVIFETDKVWYTFTIPARQEGDELSEEGVEFYGFHYLGDKFGKAILLNK